jgi:hypothetical protein
MPHPPDEVSPWARHFKLRYVISVINVKSQGAGEPRSIFKVFSGRFHSGEGTVGSGFRY